MGCSPSSERNIIIENEPEKMLIHDIKVRKDPWNLASDEETAYDPWEGSIRRADSEKSKSVTLASPPRSGSTPVENVSIVDLRAKSVVIKAAQKFSASSKSSECQTDHPEGVDFDWDLSDKTDTETQTCPPSRADSCHSEPLDVIIQTDQRIVFQSGNSKKVTFSLEDSDNIVKKTNWCQTVWEVNDKEIQVETTDLGEDDWSLSKFEASYLDSGLGLELSESQNIDSSSPHLLDDDIDELAFVHKSSVLSKRAFNGRNERNRDVGIQTDAIRDFVQGSYSDGPPDTKVDFLGDDPFFFEECDDHVLNVSKKWYKSLKKLVKHLVSITEIVKSYQDRKDLISVRSFFVWITQNLKHNPHYLEESPIIEILRTRSGSCKDFVNIFKEMCQLVDIEVTIVQGFIKDHEYVPGTKFTFSNEIHYWNAVNLEGTWRVVDSVCGAGVYNKHTEEWHPNMCENYFLTDPEEFIYSHFPHNSSDSQYFRWQLLLPPLSLDQFLQSPHLSSQFFHNGLELETDIKTPWVIHDQGIIRISGWEVMRYKYKLYSALDTESDKYNNYCFCHLEEEDRSTAMFKICPPTVDDYIIRIYGTPEANFSLGQPVNMDFLASFLIQCRRVYPKLSPWPVSDLPWGLTGDYFNLGLSLIIDDPSKWNGPRLVLKVGSKAIFKFVHLQWPILSSVALYDNQSNQLVQQMETTYFLKSSMNKDHLKSELDKGKLQAFVTKKTGPKETMFTVLAPPELGYYKLVINAARIPKKKAKVMMPVVATFLVELLELPSKLDKSEESASLLTSTNSTLTWSRSNTKLTSIPESASTSLMSASIQETSLTVSGSGVEKGSSRKSSGISIS